MSSQDPASCREDFKEGKTALPTPAASPSLGSRHGRPPMQRRSILWVHEVDGHHRESRQQGTGKQTLPQAVTSKVRFRLTGVLHMRSWMS